jgi:hypothetical protein
MREVAKTRFLSVMSKRMEARVYRRDNRCASSLFFASHSGGVCLALWALAHLSLGQRRREKLFSPNTSAESANQAWRSL